MPVDELIEKVTYLKWIVHALVQTMDRMGTRRESKAFPELLIAWEAFHGSQIAGALQRNSLLRASASVLLCQENSGRSRGGLLLVI